MTALALAPLQWGTLQDIDDVAPISEKDTNCLVEIRNVLKKYGQLDRLGIALLHSHFPLDDNEVMLEETDGENRTLTLKVAKNDDINVSDVGTIFALRDGDVTSMAWCRVFCQRSILWDHNPKAHTVEK